MRHRIFVTGSGIADEARRYLEEQGCVVRYGDPGDSAADLTRETAAFAPEGLIVRAGRISSGLLEANPALKVICKHGVGTDNIDVADATARGIPVLFTPSANREAVAEFTLALVLALLRRLPAQDRRLRSGVFDKRGYDGIDLGGKTLGLVGYGRSARRLAELVAPFGTDVIAYHPSRLADTLPHVIQAARVDDVYAAADVVSLHCPLTVETRGMIDRHALARMKRGVYLVNTARGALVRENDLLEALRSGQVAGAALDVFETEPPDLDGPLFALDSVIVTPHVAGLSDSAARAMGLDSARNVLDFLEGEPLDVGSLVNPDVVAHPGGSLRRPGGSDG